MPLRGMLIRCPNCKTAIIPAIESIGLQVPENRQAAEPTVPQCRIGIIFVRIRLGSQAKAIKDGGSMITVGHAMSMLVAQSDGEARWKDDTEASSCRFRPSLSR